MKIIHNLFLGDASAIDRYALCYKEQAKEFVRVILKGACGLLGDSCGPAELPRRYPDHPFEMEIEVALVREAGTQRDFGQ